MDSAVATFTEKPIYVNHEGPAGYRRDVSPGSTWDKLLPDTYPITIEADLLVASFPVAVRQNRGLGESALDREMLVVKKACYHSVPA